MRRCPLALALLPMSFIFAAPTALSDVMPLYVNDSALRLWQVDIDTGQADFIGSTGVQFADIAFDADDRLFGISPIFLYEIDPSNGNITPVGPHGYDPRRGHQLDSLTFGEDGALYAAGNDILVTFDLETGAGTTLGALSGHRSSGDLAFDGDGRLLMTSDLGLLVEVYVDGSGATPIGRIPYDDVYALGTTPDGEVFGVRSTNEILAFDLGSGEGEVIGRLKAGQPIGSAWGASFPYRSVPEPATLAFLVMGASLLGLRHKHARGPLGVRAR